jgi:hypothetical protein
MVDSGVQNFEIVRNHDEVKGTLEVKFHEHLLEDYHHWH